MLSEELDTLQAIYLHELQVIKDDGAREKVRINLSPATAEKAEEQFVFMTLEFVIPEKYPEEVPEIAVYNPRGLGEEEINGLMESMKNLAQEKKGQTMLYDIIELAKDRLTKNNIPHGECAICLEPFVQGQPFQKIKCLHYFHVHCLRDYMVGVTAPAKQQATDGEVSTSSSNTSAQDIGNKDKDVVCPICREAMGVTVEQLDKVPIPKADESQAAAAAAEIVSSPQVHEIQAKMQQLFVHQVAQGGIIDTEAEARKLVLTPGMTVSLPSASTPTAEASQSSDAVTTESSHSGKGKKLPGKPAGFRQNRRGGGGGGFSRKGGGGKGRGESSDGYEDDESEGITSPDAANGGTKNSTDKHSHAQERREKDETRGGKGHGRGQSRPQSRRGGNSHRNAGSRGDAKTDDSSGDVMTTSPEGDASAGNNTVPGEHSKEEGGEEKPMSYWKRKKLAMKAARAQKEKEAAEAGVDVDKPAEGDAEKKDGQQRAPGRGDNRQRKPGGRHTSERKQSEGTDANVANSEGGEGRDEAKVQPHRRRRNRTRKSSTKEDTDGAEGRPPKERTTSMSSGDATPAARGGRRRQQGSRQNSERVSESTSDRRRGSEDNRAHHHHQQRADNNTNGRRRGGGGAGVQQGYYYDDRSGGRYHDRGYYDDEGYYYDNGGRYGRDYYYEGDSYYYEDERRHGYNYRGNDGGGYASRQFYRGGGRGGQGGGGNKGSNQGYRSRYDDRKTGREFYEQLLKEKEHQDRVPENHVAASGGNGQPRQQQADKPRRGGSGQRPNNQRHGGRGGGGQRQQASDTGGDGRESKEARTAHHDDAQNVGQS